jgi:hypothetical protein
MTTALRTRLDQFIEKIAPLEPAEASWLDRQDRPALRLDAAPDTASVAIVATPTRPVAARPAMADPVPYDADKFGPLPKLFPSRRTMHPAFAFAHVALLAGVLGGALYGVSVL